MTRSGPLYTLSPIRTQTNKATSTTDNNFRPVMQPTISRPLQNMPLAMQPMMMQPIFGGFRPPIHNETINPLLYNANIHTFTYNGYQDFQTLQNGYANESKPLVGSDQFHGMGGQQSLPALPFSDVNEDVLETEDMLYHM